MGDMLNYGFPVGIRKSASESALEEVCRQIIDRLSQGGHILKTQTDCKNEAQSSQQRRSQALAQLKDEFFSARRRERQKQSRIGSRTTTEFGYLNCSNSSHGGRSVSRENR
jgi:hypothetical protein